MDFDQISFMSTEGPRFSGGAGGFHWMLAILGTGALAGDLYLKGCPSKSKKEMFGQDVSSVPILCQYDDWMSSLPMILVPLLLLLAPMSAEVKQYITYAFVAWGVYKLLMNVDVCVNGNCI
tara:strand:- start:299 stop:661 length:363 start_codon:yes stop_codon:yes gene_type:complete